VLAPRMVAFYGDKIFHWKEKYVFTYFGISSKPFIVMTREQVERIIAESPPQEQERIKNMLRHSCSFYDFSGKHLPHQYEQENLLDVIGRRDAYIVDTNSEWKRESKNHLDKAFVITPSLSREHSNTKELILDEARCQQGNIFSVGIIPQQKYIMVDRIDIFFRHCFDDFKLSQASKGKGEIFASERNAQLQRLESEKQQVRFQVGLELLFSVNAGQPSVSKTFWTTGKARDLPSPDEMKYATNGLKIKIKQLFSQCRHNVNKSKALVEMCHRTLLLEDKVIRAEFDDPKKENVFGDMYILFGAVYLGASIMTRDGRLTIMAGYAGINCCHVPRARNVASTSSPSY
jgi:hypothetical protein